MTQRTMVPPRSCLVGLLVAGACAGDAWGVRCGDYPAHIHLEGRVDTPGYCWAVAVTGMYAVLADQDAMRVVDISTPYDPVLVNSLDLPDTLQHVTVVGDFAYVTAPTMLHVVDLADPAGATEFKTIPLRPGARRTTVSSGFAYVATDTIGLQVVDLDSSAVVGTATGGWFRGRDVEVRGKLAFLADASRWLRVFDVSDPAHPLLIGSEAAPPGNGPPTAIAIQDEFAWVANGQGGLLVFDIGVPTDPQYRARVFTPHNALDVAVEGPYAYVSEWVRGLQVVDISDPLLPRIVGGVDTPYDAEGVAVSGPFAYLANGQSGLYVVHIKNPRSVPAIGRTPAAWRASAIDVRGVLGAVANGDGGFQILDVSDPTAPVVVGTVNPPDYIRGVTMIDEQHVGVAAGDRGLLIVDISDPADPRIVAETAPSSFRAAGTMHGTWILGGGDLLEIVDVSDLESPTPVASLDIPGRFSQVVTDDRDVAYLMSTETGILLVDIRDPGALGILSAIPAPAGFSYPLAVADGLLYHSAGGPVLQIDDVSDPLAPVYVGGCSLTSSVGALAVYRGYLYTVSGIDGIHVVDVSDPQEPFQIGTLNPPQRSSDIKVANGMFYVAQGDQVAIYPLQCPDGSVVTAPPLPGDRALKLAPPRPTPFRTRVSLCWSLPTEVAVRLTVHDVAGRLVHVLRDGVLAPGTHEASWDGTNARGAHQAAGVYFVRLSAGGEIRTRKVVLSR